MFVMTKNSSILFLNCSSLSFTEEQKDFFYDKSREFVREGNQSGLLQYGILSKYKAYQLQTVYYPSYKYNGTTIMYMGKNNKKDFKKGNYLGFDCSGFVSFIYHYVFIINCFEIYYFFQNKYITFLFSSYLVIEKSLKSIKA